jgi:hypothetical protein
MFIRDQHCIGLKERLIVSHLIIDDYFRILHVDPPECRGSYTQPLRYWNTQQSGNWVEKSRTHSHPRNADVEHGNLMTFYFVI